MFCIECGKKNQARAKFCFQCGAAIEVTGSKSQEKPISGRYQSKELGPDSAAWMLAIFPAIMGLIVISINLTVGNQELQLWIPVVVAFLVNTVLVLWDSKNLAKKNIRVRAVLGIVFIPWYLYRRAEVTRGSQWPVFSWIAASSFGFVIVILSIFTIGYSADLQSLEEQIKADLKAQLDTKGVYWVKCPSSVLVQPGKSFECQAAVYKLGQISLQVTFQNSQGDVIWRTTG